MSSLMPKALSSMKMPGMKVPSCFRSTNGRNTTSDAFASGLGKKAGLLCFRSGRQEGHDPTPLEDFGPDQQGDHSCSKSDLHSMGDDEQEKINRDCGIVMLNSGDCEKTFSLMNENAFVEELANMVGPRDDLLGHFEQVIVSSASSCGTSPSQAIWTSSLDRKDTSSQGSKKPDSAISLPKSESPEKCIYEREVRLLQMMQRLSRRDRHELGRFVHTNFSPFIRTGKLPASSTTAQDGGSSPGDTAEAEREGHTKFKEMLRKAVLFDPPPRPDSEGDDHDEDTTRALSCNTFMTQSDEILLSKVSRNGSKSQKDEHNATDELDGGGLITMCVDTWRQCLLMLRAEHNQREALQGAITKIQSLHQIQDKSCACPDETEWNQLERAVVDLPQERRETLLFRNRPPKKKGGRHKVDLFVPQFENIDENARFPHRPENDTDLASTGLDRRKPAYAFGGTIFRVLQPELAGRMVHVFGGYRSSELVPQMRERGFDVRRGITTRVFEDGLLPALARKEQERKAIIQAREDREKNGKRHGQSAPAGKQGAASSPARATSAAASSASADLRGRRRSPGDPNAFSTGTKSLMLPVLELEGRCGRAVVIIDVVEHARTLPAQVEWFVRVCDHIGNLPGSLYVMICENQQTIEVADLLGELCGWERNVIDGAKRKCSMLCMRPPEATEDTEENLRSSIQEMIKMLGQDKELDAESSAEQTKKMPEGMTAEHDEDDERLAAQRVEDRERNAGASGDDTESVPIPGVVDFLCDDFRGLSVQHHNDREDDEMSESSCSLWDGEAPGDLDESEDDGSEVEPTAQPFASFVNVEARREARDRRTTSSSGANTSEDRGPSLASTFDPYLVLRNS
ncbi:unnamed protein product [Amoebophrya sp. A120]|nr:unnamed protein product [Amoebophrya sp. A120]|eukprot:GSA120T00003568001.1